jgi:hypothetical protein
MFVAWAVLNPVTSRLVKDWQPLNILEKFVTEAVLNFETFRLVKDAHPWNIPCIAVTFDVSKDVRSSEVMPEHPLNIEDISVTLEVFSFDKSCVVKDVQLANILDIFVTFEVSRLLKSMLVSAVLSLNISLLSAFATTLTPLCWLETYQVVPLSHPTTPLSCSSERSTVVDPSGAEASVKTILVAVVGIAALKVDPAASRGTKDFFNENLFVKTELLER